MEADFAAEPPNWPISNYSSNSGLVTVCHERSTYRVQLLAASKYWRSAEFIVPVFGEIAAITFERDESQWRGSQRKTRERGRLTGSVRGAGRHPHLLPK